MPVTGDSGISDEPFICPACNGMIPGLLPDKIIPNHDDHVGNDCVLGYKSARCVCKCGCAALYVHAKTPVPSEFCNPCLQAALEHRTEHGSKEK